MNDLDLDNPAWRFGLDLYGRPGISAECLALQDEAGLDVSLFLVCLWLGAERGVVLDAGSYAEAAGLATRWAELAVHPLRAARRGLKTTPEIAWPAVAAFRARLQKLEIEAERMEIALLHDWARRRAFPEAGAPPQPSSAGALPPHAEVASGARPRSTHSHAALSNLHFVLAAKGAEPGQAAAIATALGDRTGDAK